MAKKQMILKVVVYGMYMKIVQGCGDSLGATMLFLELCRAALIKRAELEQSLLPFERYPDPHPFHLCVGSGDSFSFHSDSLSVWRDGIGAWLIYGPDRESVRTIIEIAAQNLGAQLEMPKLETPKPSNTCAETAETRKDDYHPCPCQYHRRGPDIC